MRLASLLVGLAVVLPGSADAQGQEATEPAAGCYRIDLGQWTPALHPGNARFQVPPARFRLDTIKGETLFERGKRTVRPVIPHGRTPSAFWERIGEDSIRIVWTNGFAGARLHLRIPGDSLSGTARAFKDVVGPPVPEAEVHGRRIDCVDVPG